jgi:hypothetical protein
MFASAVVGAAKPVRRVATADYDRACRVAPFGVPLQRPADCEWGGRYGSRRDQDDVALAIESADKWVRAKRVSDED